MKRLSMVIVFAFMMLNNLYSQENTKNNELGFYFSNLSAFGIQYKFGNENMLFRLTALSLSAGYSDNNNGTGVTQDKTTAGAGLHFGVQFPVKIKEHFNFYYGGELQGSYTHSLTSLTGSSDSKSNIYMGGIGFVMGFSYLLRSNIIFSIEIIPNINYSYNYTGTNKTNSVNFGLNNNSAGINISYRF